LIDDAALIADGCPAVASYTAGRQIAIIKWLTAHLIASRGDGMAGGSGVLLSNSLGDASKTFAEGTLGARLQSSHYGQQALALDPSGCLGKLGATRATLSFF
jgi:hypothetical protein